MANAFTVQIARDMVKLDPYFNSVPNKCIIKNVMYSDESIKYLK